MNDQTYDNPAADGATRAAQAAAISATLADALLRVQQERAAQRIAHDERLATAANAYHEASHASARVAWAPALNDRWLQQAEVTQVLNAWAPAAGWAAADDSARAAAGRAEQRLTAMYPEAMHRYALARADGSDPAAAMGEAAPAFAESHRANPTTNRTSLTAADTRTIAGQTVSRAPTPSHARARQR